MVWPVVQGGCLVTTLRCKAKIYTSQSCRCNSAFCPIVHQAKTLPYFLPVLPPVLPVPLPSCSAAAHGLHIVLSPIPIPSRRHLLLSTFLLLPSSPSPNPDLLLSTDRNQKAGGTFRSKNGRRSEIGSGQAPNRSSDQLSKEVCVNVVAGYLLNLSGKAMWQNSMRHNKGIRVPPETNFCYEESKEGLKLFVFEAGVNPSHVATMQNDIHIYVIKEGKKTYIATLSSAYPRIQLDVMMSTGMEIHHTSLPVSSSPRFPFLSRARRSYRGCVVFLMPCLSGSQQKSQLTQSMRNMLPKKV